MAKTITLHFQDFVKNAEQAILTGQSNIKSNHNKAIKALQLIFEDAKIFIVDLVSPEKPIDIKIDEEGGEYEYSMPFKTVFLEGNISHLGTLHSGNEKNDLTCVALLFDEISPEEFQFSGFFYNRIKRQPHLYSGLIKTTEPIFIIQDEFIDAHKIMATQTLRNFCNLLKNSEFGTETYMRNVKTGTKATGKRTYFINHIVRIRPKKSQEHVVPIIAKEVQWSHSWFVRGHWRVLHDPLTIGKNRAGQYCQKGFTWVIDHIKGPDDKEVIDKIRVL